MGPLESIRVLDLTSMVSGPVAAMMLADQGADVIKVEPIRGEQMRYLGVPHHGIPAAFYSCNRGKRSLALDLKQQDGKGVLGDLICGADVLIQNFRPGVMERMGFGESEVRALNARLIYVSISGFGEEGPYAHKRVYDPVIQALSGATEIQADRKTGEPAMFRIIIADKVTSLTAAQAVSSALFHRERTGEGQHIRLSMLEAMLAFFWPEAMGGLTFAEREYAPTGGTMDLVFKAQGGHITAGAISDSEWVGMCRALKREELIDDERFATAAARVRNADERKQIMAEEIARWDREALLVRLDEHDVPSAPLLTRPELLQHQQIVTNESIDHSVYPGFGEVRQAKPAARFSRSPSGIQSPAPQLGEHSREILEELGYDEARCRALVEDGVVLAR